VSDPFKDTRDPLVRTMERRSLEESWASEKRLSARIVKLETALRQALEYIELDSETPVMLPRWKKALTPADTGAKS
jgi:hypothetical protein